MSSAPRSETAQSADAPVAARRARFSAWPLWAALAGVAGFVGTVLTDLRPDAELAAAEQGQPYTVTYADMNHLDPLLGRIGYVAGIVAVIALLVFQAAWRRHVEVAFVRSTAARVVSGAVIATAGAAALGYGWRGALANYLGPESFNYEQQGVFVYYMLTDFGAYLPWLPMVAAAGALAWMAWVERSVSRVLGTLCALVTLALLGAVVATGVPGLPGALLPLWLTIVGVWLAVGRSRITQAIDVR
ncbi:hypothetical protein [Agromyces bauzanensis]